MERAKTPPRARGHVWVLTILAAALFGTLLVRTGVRIVPAMAAATWRNPQMEAFARDVNKLIGDFEATEAGKAALARAQTHRIIVKTAQPLSRTYNAAATVGGYDGLYLLQFNDAAAAEAARARLQADTGVEYAEPDVLLRAQALSWGAAAIGSVDYADRTANGKTARQRVKVAIVDTGVDGNHPFLRGRVLKSDANFTGASGDPQDDNGHGTHVAGIVADNTGDHVKILPVKVLGADGMGKMSQIALGIAYAIDSGCDVINLSLGAPGTAPRTLRDAIARAEQSGIVIAAAAGNNRTDASGVYPANMATVLSVGATAQSGAITSTSNFGGTVDIFAPGAQIMSTAPNNSYRSMSGTSMAAAFASAAAAELCAAAPDFSAAQLRRAIVSCASRRMLGEPGRLRSPVLSMAGFAEYAARSRQRSPSCGWIREISSLFLTCKPRSGIIFVA
ncbi:MAG: S8 family serine peptidase [Oscillospiraceae bacterium]|jgi:subtilisin family serine protease|nr:S8 family serine peptidase [Oscillospiraceae bacterium]